MFRFIAPFYYLYFSRFTRLSEVLSLIWIYPLYLTGFIFIGYEAFSISNLVAFLIGLTAWMCVYEVGYMENDALTIRKESNPNIRISRKDIDYIQTNFSKLTWIRYAEFGLLTSALFYFALLSFDQLVIFVVSVALVRWFFFLHNYFRSRINILTYFLLCLIKYTVFPAVFLGWVYGWEPYVVILVSFPVLRTLEHAAKDKYGLTRLQVFVLPLDRFRVFYYGVCLLLGFSLVQFVGYPVVLVYSLLYFFVFRFGVYWMVKSGSYSRETG